MQICYISMALFHHEVQLRSKTGHLQFHLYLSCAQTQGWAQSWTAFLLTSKSSLLDHAQHSATNRVQLQSWLIQKHKMHPWSLELQTEFVQKPQLMMIFIDPTSKFDMDAADIWQVSDRNERRGWYQVRIKMSTFNENVFVAVDASWTGG